MKEPNKTAASAALPAEATAVAVAQPDFTGCPHWGKGGRYLYDPATGKRTPAPAAAESAAATESIESTTVKGI